MGDDGFDPCRPIWDNELAIQRLLSILRQAQSYCTDTECFDLETLPGPDEQPTPNIFLTYLILSFIGLMFILRPKLLQEKGTAKSKAPDGSDSSDDPPAPPMVN